MLKMWTGTGKLNTVSLEETAIVQQVFLGNNPVGDELEIYIQSNTRQSVMLQIIDSSGRVMNKKELELGVGQTRTALKTNHLVSGVYFIRLDTAAGQKTLRFVKN